MKETNLHRLTFWAIVILVDMAWSWLTAYFIQERPVSIIVNIGLCSISTLLIARVYMLRLNR
jgi:hypothetical protein